MRIKVTVRRFPDRKALQLRWTDPVTGKARTQSAETSDKSEAEEKRADLEYQLNHGLHSEPLKVTWAAFRGAFEAEYLPNVRKNTRRCYADALDLFEEIAAPKQLASLTARQASAFVAGMRAFAVPRRGGITAYKSSTIATNVQYLKGALSWAVRQGLLAELPEFPAIRTMPPTPQPVPAELYERLRGATNRVQLLAYFSCAWLAGLRRNEAYHLQWEQSEDKPYLDLGRRRVVFPAISVKGARDQWVPLCDELRAELEALPRQGQGVFRFGCCAENMSAIVERVAKRARVRLSYKSLRRGFGCRYAARVPAQVLQRLMRHADINTTLRFYCGMDEAVEAAVFGAGNSQGNTHAKNPEISGVSG